MSELYSEKKNAHPLTAHARKACNAAADRGVRDAYSAAAATQLSYAEKGAAPSAGRGVAHAAWRRSRGGGATAANGAAGSTGGRPRENGLGGGSAPLPFAASARAAHTRSSEIR